MVLCDDFIFGFYYSIQINVVWYENLLMIQQIIQIDVNDVECQVDLVLLCCNVECFDCLQEDYDKIIFSDVDCKFFE